MPHSDDELMKGVGDGDTSAFAELFQRYQSEVVNFAYRQCGDYAKAEDIAQECFLRVYRNARAYLPAQAGQGGNFRNWLWTITLNVTRSHFSRWSERMKPVSMDCEVADKTVEHETELEKAEMEAMIQKALEQLPAEQREVVVLKHFHNLKFREIAVMLNLPVDTVKSRMRYGLLKLSDLLKGSGGYEL